MDTFSALAVPRRRQILELLAARGELAATQISDRFTITPAAISQHLKILREANLVDMEKRSQQRVYRINPKKIFELEVWTQKMVRLWEDRFDRLDTLLTTATLTSHKPLHK